MDKRLLNAYNTDINSQLGVLEEIVRSSKALNKALKLARTLNIDNYYIGAGCVAQTVWNYISDKSLDYGIDDIDFVYFDDKNLDWEEENRIKLNVCELYSDLGIRVDVKNQARVHLWYKEHFGYAIEPYLSLELAINTWPTTATAIGIRKCEDDKLKVYAPFGLNDLCGKIVRANKAQITKSIYESKVKKWISKWPDLKIIPWENA